MFKKLLCWLFPICKVLALVKEMRVRYYDDIFPELMEVNRRLQRMENLMSQLIEAIDNVAAQVADIATDVQTVLEIAGTERTALQEQLANAQTAIEALQAAWDADELEDDAQIAALQVTIAELQDLVNGGEALEKLTAISGALSGVNDVLEAAKGTEPEPEPAPEE